MPENIGYQFNRLYAAPIETYRQVNTITNRNAIPLEIRWEGMACYVVSENQDYQLVGGVDNSNWVNAGETVSNPTTHFKGFFNATTVTPAISNLNGIEGDEYKVTNGGVNVDFGAGDVFLETDDILIFYQSQWRVKVRPGSGGTLTANRALLSNASGKVDVSTVTSTELGYVSGVTSPIQTQLNAKLASSSYTASDVLDKIKTVDGTGSGLDADLLRGVHWGNVNTPIISSSTIALGGNSVTGRGVTINSVGNSSPNGANSLHILTPEGGGFDIFATSAAANPTWDLRTFGNEPISISPGSAQSVLLNTSGNVSIGNTNNTYKLDVTGTGRFTGTAIAAPATLSTELVTKGQLDAAARPYKVYTALLTQTGTSAPTAIVLENTLGGTVVWSRAIAGRYNGTLTGVFTNSKTIVFATIDAQASGPNSIIKGNQQTVNSITIETMNSGTLADGAMEKASVEVRVYP